MFMTNGEASRLFSQNFEKCFIFPATEFEDSPPSNSQFLLKLPKAKRNAFYELHAT